MRDRSNECRNPPCANCGKERGGRMFAPFWGHNFSCCSEKCGREFARLHEQKARTPEGRKWLSEKWEWLESRCNYTLTGKPFPGYPEKLDSDEGEERARIAEQEKAKLIDFIRKVLDAGDWYIGALEIDPYRQNPANGEELEAEGRALLAKHNQQ